MKKLIAVILTISLLCLGLTACTVKGVPTTQTQTPSDNTQTFEPTTPGLSLDGIDFEKDIFAEIVIKNYGIIKLELDHGNAPITVENFVSLATSGFYDGLTFHRIMEGFMMQGGDPDGNGTGGSDKNIKGEFLSNGVNNPISHTRGTISMARNGYDMNSASSQFFIMHEDYTGLDGDYAAFGHVIEGIEVVDKVCEQAQPIDNNGTIPSSEQPVIEMITIYQ